MNKEQFTWLSQENFTELIINHYRYGDNYHEWVIVRDDSSNIIVFNIWISDLFTEFMYEWAWTRDYMIVNWKKKKFKKVKMDFDYINNARKLWLIN